MALQVIHIYVILSTEYILSYQRSIFYLLNGLYIIFLTDYTLSDQRLERYLVNVLIVVFFFLQRVHTKQQLKVRVRIIHQVFKNGLCMIIYIFAYHQSIFADC